MELLLVFPILMMLLAGMIQFSMMLHARQQLVAASREGARVAALGGDATEVERAVKRSLGNGRLGEAVVTMTTDEDQPVASALQVPQGEAVAVWVRLPTTRAVPDLLRFIGYSIRDDEIVARTIMRRE
jgi:Flp pilus assembly protein TadG